MKKVKNYIQADLAKKKIIRYKYWSVKDENGITICSNEDNNPDNKTFSDILDKIIADNVDAEVQIKYGTNEQSSRQNPPFFIRINEEIEWIDPEEDETVSINGVQHKVDRNGNVNINLTTPTKQENYEQMDDVKPEWAKVDTFRQEMDLQLQGLRNEYALKEEKMQADLQNRLLEQTLKFKEMMLSERESRILEREQQLLQQESVLEDKKKEISEDVKGYLKQVPTALGGLIKEWVKDGGSQKGKGLGKAEEKKKPQRRKVDFTVEPDKKEEELTSIEPTQSNFDFEEIQTEESQETNTQENEDIQD